MLGYRGIRRSLDEPDVFAARTRRVRTPLEMGYDNVQIMFPLVNDAEDVLRARDLLAETGIDPEKRSWGVMIETPAIGASSSEIAQAGINFVSFGTNDLTQYTLAVDRNNENVADRFDELHPAVLRLIGQTIERCREHDINTSICGQAGSKPEMVRLPRQPRRLVHLGEHRRGARRATRGQTRRTEADVGFGSITRIRFSGLLCDRVFGVFRRVSLTQLLLDSALLTEY